MNIGKNKWTPLEEAHLDYQKIIPHFEGLADYLVVNVSSPNTPGLRKLQSMDALRPILTSVKGELSKWAQECPLFLKLSPEYVEEASQEELKAYVGECEKVGVDGWVLTNTLAGEYEGGPGG